MTARTDYPLLDVTRQAEEEDEMWPSEVEWWRQHHAALDEIDRLRSPRPKPAPNVWDVTDVPISVLNIVAAAIAWHHHPANIFTASALHDAVELRLAEVREPE